MNTVVDLSKHDIDALKAKYAKLKLITVSTSDKCTHQFLIVRPTTSMMDMIGKYYNDDKPHKAREVLRNSCVIDGDKTILDSDDDVRNNVFKRISEMFDSLEIEEKEL